MYLRFIYCLEYQISILMSIQSLVFIMAYKKQIETIYSEYFPVLLPKLERDLITYKGKEKEYIEKLKHKILSISDINNISQDLSKLELITVQAKDRNVSHSTEITNDQEIKHKPININNNSVQINNIEKKHRSKSTSIISDIYNEKYPNLLENKKMNRNKQTSIGISNSNHIEHIQLNLANSVNNCNQVYFDIPTSTLFDAKYNTINQPYVSRVICNNSLLFQQFFSEQISEYSPPLDIKESIKEIYKKHFPDKIPTLNKALYRYKGNELTLLKILHKMVNNPTHLNQNITVNHNTFDELNTNADTYQMDINEYQSNCSMCSHISHLNRDTLNLSSSSNSINNRNKYNFDIKPNYTESNISTPISHHSRDKFMNVDNFSHSTV